MGWYADLKIGNKLLLGFASVILISMLVGIAGIVGIKKIDNMLVELYSTTLVSTIYASDAYTQLITHNRRFYRYILSMRKEVQKQVAAEVHQNEQNITDALTKYRSTDLTSTELELLNRFDRIWPEYIAITDRAFTLANSGKDQEAYILAEEEGRPLYYKLNEIFEGLNNHNLAEGKQHHDAAKALFESIQLLLACLVGLALIVGTVMAWFITRSVVKPLKLVSNAVSSLLEGSEAKAHLAEAIAAGDLNQDVVITKPLQIETGSIARDEAGSLLQAVTTMSSVQATVDQSFTRMTAALRLGREADKARDWLKSGSSELNSLLRGDRKAEEMIESCLSYLCEYLAAGVGAFYFFNEKADDLEIVATYALTRRKRLNERIGLGEGLAGQAARERKVICLTNVPPDYLPITFSLGEARPCNIAAVPLIHDNRLIGVVEIGSFHPFSDLELEFLQKAREALAIGISVNIARQQVDELLEQTQSQAEELRVQQEELQQTNEELEERAQLLEQQREQIRAKNHEMEEAGREIRRKAEELERVSTYKSEFLANMSHELRTPLNSLMILSSMLRDNREKNLTAKQVEYAATINSAGADLLSLINDILDLSKIESGRMELHFEEISICGLCEQMKTLFYPVTNERGLTFVLDITDSAPIVIQTDTQRTQQILNNLLSNACKFTSQGTVSLQVYTPGKDSPLKAPAIAFAVTDTGIGIPKDKQELIFYAFQQADGSTSRKYGGTGLGLSLSRKLAQMMTGEITLTSEPGRGSTFTLYLPVSGSNQLLSAVEPDPSANQFILTGQTSEIAQNGSSSPVVPVVPIIISPAPIPDDRKQMQNGNKSILIIEDDLNFAGILVDMVRSRGFSVLVAAEGESGIALAERYHPSAILLDVMLPHIDGWGVMRSLKDNPATRHIPVHFITCLEERQKAMSMGAIGYVTKPVNREQLDTVFCTLESAIDKTVKMLLIVEDDVEQAKAMVALLEERNVTIKVAETGSRAIELLSCEQFDCIVLDLGLADMGAFELLEEVKKLDPGRRIPVIIHTGHDLTHAEEVKLRHYAESIIIKGAKSPERLLNEVTLFLHLVETSLNPDKQRMIRTALDKEVMLEGKKILIVDDDMRNIFSLSSALAEKNIIIFEAETGLEALKQLEEHPDMDLVLMDIMMPEMDGYEAMRAIRKDPRFKLLPIIALTAKAMKGDREECLKAGASDYTPKPVDMDKLFSLLRVWLYSTVAFEPIGIE